MSTGTYFAQAYSQPPIWTDATRLSLQDDQKQSEVRSFDEIFERLLPAQQLVASVARFFPIGSGTAVDSRQGARGLVVSPDENQARFGALPMDAIKARMDPALFEVFSRFAGLIPSHDNLNVVEITELPRD